MFLTWINRNKRDHALKHTKKPYYELFNSKEKRYLFEHVICPTFNQPGAQMNLVKLFHTYFMSINIAEGALNKQAY